MIKQLRSVAMLVVIVMFSMTSPALADNEFLRAVSTGDGFDIGIGTFNIGLQARYLSDSNIYRASSNEIADTITVMTPAARLLINTKRNDLSLGYSNDIYSYTEYQQEDYTAETAYIDYTMNSMGGLVISVNDTYNITNGIRPELNAPERKKYMTNKGRGGIAYTFPGGRLTTEVSYSMMQLEYDNDADMAYNRKDQGYGFAIYYKVLPKTAFFMEYLSGANDYYDSVDETTDADSDSSAVNIGLKWDATAKMSGTLKLGGESVDYVNTNFDEYDEDLFIVDTRLSYKSSDTTKVNILLNRSLMESVYTGNVAENLSASSNYLRTKYALGFNTRFVNRVDLAMDMGMENHLYKSLVPAEDERVDDIVTFDMSLDYIFHKTFSMGVGYEYQDKTSNDPNHEETHSNWFARVRYNI